MLQVTPKMATRKGLAMSDLLAHGTVGDLLTRISELEAERDDLRDERNESRREARQACVALADGFVPKAERSGAHLQGLPRLTAHAVDHHAWHHDAADASYVAKVEGERDAALDEVARLQAPEVVLGMAEWLLREAGVFEATFFFEQGDPPTEVALDHRDGRDTVCAHTLAEAYASLRKGGG